MAEIASGEFNPVGPAPQPVESKNTVKRVVLIVLGLLVIVGGVFVSAYIYTNRNASADTAGSGQAEMKTNEYQNPNGFSFTYPEGVKLEENDKGVVLDGESETDFVVSSLEGDSLLEEVNSIAKNFYISAGDIKTSTLNSRVGFKFKYNDSSYYYFPLFNDLYLEIVDKVPSEGDSEVVSSIKFTPPTAQLR